MTDDIDSQRVAFLLLKVEMYLREVLYRTRTTLYFYQINRRKEYVDCFVIIYCDLFIYSRRSTGNNSCFMCHECAYPAQRAHTTQKKRLAELIK